MSNNKQSSVEYAVEKLENLIPPGNQIIISLILEQAKAMHKEEIEITFAKSYLIGVEGISYDDANKASAKYYNETFNSDEA